MHTSRYLIQVELGESKFLLVHGYTGAIDFANKKVIEALQTNNFQDISTDILKLLSSRGYITSLPFDDEKIRMASAVDRLLLASRNIAKNFVFLITYDCNLHCAYCYEQKIKQKGDNYLKKRLSAGQINNIFRCIDQIISGKERVINITLFGGEPFLMENKGIVELIVNKAIENGYTVDAISNGLNLLEFSNLLKPDKIGFVQITIDGPEEVHNKRRNIAGGSFKGIIRGIENSLANGVQISVRMNIDNSNVNYVKELVSFFSAQGWLENDNFSFSPEPLTFEDMTKTLNSIEIFDRIKTDKRLKSQYFKQYFSPYGNKKSNGLEFPNFKCYHCSAMNSMYIFDPFENIYPCLEVVGDEGFAIGSYKNGLKWNDTILNKWKNRTVKEIDRCLECPYALFCAGGCPIGALRVNGEMFSSFCDGFQQMFCEVAREKYKS